MGRILDFEDGFTSSTAPTSGGAGALKTEYYQLDAPDVSAQSFSLTNSPAVPSEVLLDVIGGPTMQYTTDFTISGNTVDLGPIGADISVGDVFRIVYTL